MLWPGSLRHTTKRLVENITTRTRPIWAADLSWMHGWLMPLPGIPRNPRWMLQAIDRVVDNRYSTTIWCAWSEWFISHVEQAIACAHAYAILSTYVYLIFKLTKFPEKNIVMNHWTILMFLLYFRNIACPSLIPLSREWRLNCTILKYKEWVFVSNEIRGIDFIVESHPYSNEFRNYFEIQSAGNGLYRIYNPAYKCWLYVSYERFTRDKMVLCYQFGPGQPRIAVRDLFDFKLIGDTVSYSIVLY